MSKDIEQESSFDSGKYSPTLDDILNKPVNSSDVANINPIFCVGLNRNDVHALRNAFMSYMDEEVRIYGFYNNHNIIPQRVGLLPRVLVVNTVPIVGDLRHYVTRNRIPVLRVLDERCQLVQLPYSDYYSGVYETVAHTDLSNSKVVTSMVELGIRIFNRNRGSNSEMSEFVKMSLHEVLEIPATASGDLLLKSLLSA
jgi:hypothetical protein